MKHIDKLEELLKKQHGTIVSSDLSSYDIPRVYLQMMVSEGKLDKVGRGIYVSIDSIEDVLYSTQAKYPKIVYSHETALYLHSLSDRTPDLYSSTVPSGYKVVGNMSNQMKFYYIDKKLHQLGVVTMLSNHGNPIKVYNVERTICDIIRSRNRIDVQLLTDALKKYTRTKYTDISLLLSYARELKIEKILKHYLEILL